MSIEISDVAIRHAPLLREIDKGDAATPAELAERAGVIPNNLHRMMTLLATEGLIVREPDGPKHKGELTPRARRALDLLTLAETGASPAAKTRIPLLRIKTSNFNPRTDLETEDAKASIADLADSIVAKDVLQPIQVRTIGDDYYEIVAGERRYRAAFLAVCDGRLPSDYTIPAIVRELSDEDAEEAALIENVQRDDLHWMDEAEAFLRLARRRSAAQIQQMIGQRRSKRSVQDFVQLARELAPEDKARARLRKDDPSYLPYDKARYLVGNKSPRPASELGDRLAMTLLELAIAGLLRPAPEIGEPGYVKLAAKPKAGPLITLQDKGLITLKAQAGEAYAKALAHSAANRHLIELGLLDEVGRMAPPDAWKGILAEARGRVVPKDVAANLGVEPFLTGELNVGASTSATAAPANGLFAGDPAPTPARLDALALSPKTALAVLEIGHKLLVHGQRAVAFRHGAFVDINGHAAAPGFPDGKLLQELVYDRLIFTTSHTANGVNRIVKVSLTPTAEHWLTEQGLDRDERGYAVVPDEVIYAAQLAAHGSSGDLADGYMTAWLNDEADADVPLAERIEANQHMIDKHAEPAKPSFQSPLFGQIKEALADHGPEPEEPTHAVRDAEGSAERPHLSIDTRSQMEIAAEWHEARNAAIRQLIRAVALALPMLELAPSKRLDAAKVEPVLEALRKAQAAGREAFGEDPRA